MKIVPVSVLPSYKIANNPIRQINNRYSFSCDIVSFSGNKNETLQGYSDVAQQGIAIGKKILSLSKKNPLQFHRINGILNENSPVQIKVDDIKNNPFMMGNNSIIAHMLPGYDKDCQLSLANIYVGKMPSTSKERSDFAANIAHEYTHVLQRAKDTRYYGILDYTDNQDEIAMIGRMSKTVMDKMGQMCQGKLFPEQNQIVKVLNSILNGSFNIGQTLGKIDFELTIDNAAQLVAKRLNRNSDEIKTLIRNWIIQESQNEVEAYSVTLKVLEDSKNYDPRIKASRVLSRDIYSYINKALQ